MTREELERAAQHNRWAFDEVLCPYVQQKLEATVGRGRTGQAGWFDASGCVWCLFDDEAFERTGSAASELREQPGGCGLQVYWSVEDVVMPGECDETWVARRIAAEAAKQLVAQGLVCKEEWRDTAEGRHLGVTYRRGSLLDALQARVRGAQRRLFSGAVDVVGAMREF
ncbi:MAG: hypothetical protein J6D34_03715 [Atopobiaceae bacterium]|nr:hypothetical protein [Atopobiaceae bacterium]